MRIMLDTNILVSAIFFRSPLTNQLIHKLEGHKILLCDYVIQELRLVAERKFPNKYLMVEKFLVSLPFECIHTPKSLQMQDLPEIRDTKDAPILATALLENVDIFLTGDQGFLVLDLPEESMRIMTMREFIEQGDEESNL